MGKISIVGVLRLRAKSAVSRDRSVRRYAQDDDFVGVLKNKHPQQVSAYGGEPQAHDLSGRDDKFIAPTEQ
jgi:hypothetical protein